MVVHVVSRGPYAYGYRWLWRARYERVFSEFAGYDEPRVVTVTL